MDVSIHDYKIDEETEKRLKEDIEKLTVILGEMRLKSSPVEIEASIQNFKRLIAKEKAKETPDVAFINECESNIKNMPNEIAESKKQIEAVEALIARATKLKQLPLEEKIILKLDETGNKEEDRKYLGSLIANIEKRKENATSQEEKLILDTMIQKLDSAKTNITAGKLPGEILLARDEVGYLAGINFQNPKVESYSVLASLETEMQQEQNRLAKGSKTADSFTHPLNQIKGFKEELLKPHSDPVSIMQKTENVAEQLFRDVKVNEESSNRFKTRMLEIKHNVKQWLAKYLPIKVSEEGPEFTTKVINTSFELYQKTSKKKEELERASKSEVPAGETLPIHSKFNK